MAASTAISQAQPSVGNFNAAAVLNTIVGQATGGALAQVDTSNFVSVANTALGISTDALLNAISQVLSRTIFSIRPYSRKFGGLYQDSIAFGNHVRKLNIQDSDWQKDLRYDLTDGNSVDDQIVSKPGILQTNFYGQNIVSRQVTIFRDQLNIALSSEAEFQRFITMIMTNASDQIEQAHEATARATLANFIGGKVQWDSANVVNLLDGYNTAAGTALTSATVYEPDNFVPFVKWAFAQIMMYSKYMTERTYSFHQNITGKNIARHTPYRMQKLYMLSQFMTEAATMVLSDVFNENRLKLMDYEEVGFWQTLASPDEINVKAIGLDDTTGNATTATAVTQSGIIGCLFDAEAVGITTCNEWSAPSPFNARGGYSNIFWHFNDRYYNDFTENGIVFVIADA